MFIVILHCGILSGYIYSVLKERKNCTIALRDTK